MCPTGLMISGAAAKAGVFAPKTLDEGIKLNDQRVDCQLQPLVKGITYKKNAEDIIGLAEALRENIYGFSLVVNKVEANLLDTQAIIERETRYSAAIREIEMAILGVKFEVAQLQEALDVTSNGKLSSMLIHPYNLLVIFQQVNLQLHAGLSVLVGLTVEKMYVYYAVATVHAVATSRSIRLLIVISLKVVDRYFELYQVHSLPFFHKGIGKFMIDENFTYLAVAEDRQFFAVMSPYRVSKCTQELYRVCPTDMMLKRAGEQDCLIALFLGKTKVIHTKCKRLLLNEPFDPVWIRSPDSHYWVYSLSSPQQVTVHCQEIGPLRTIKRNYQMMTEGTGIIANASSCYVHADDFKLLPHSRGKTTVDLTRGHLVLPDIEDILNLSEESLFQPDVIPLVDLQQVNEIEERAISRSHTKRIDVDKAVMMLRGGEKQCQPT
jgi:hypothetical protein